MCKNVSDSEVVKMAHEGKSMREIQCEKQVGSNCGACTQEFKKIYESSTPKHKKSTDI